MTKPKTPPRAGERAKVGRNLYRGFLVRAPDDELDEWRDDAKERGETLTDWLREAARDRLRKKDEK